MRVVAFRTEDLDPSDMVFAASNAYGFCSCGVKVYGRVRLGYTPHFVHASACPHDWEHAGTEGEWHAAWKRDAYSRGAALEVTMTGLLDGRTVTRRADAVAVNGAVIEFQSYRLTEPEQAARYAFYATQSAPQLWIYEVPAERLKSNGAGAWTWSSPRRLPGTPAVHVVLDLGDRLILVRRYRLGEKRCWVYGRQISRSDVLKAIAVGLEGWRTADIDRATPLHRSAVRPAVADDCVRSPEETPAPVPPAPRQPAAPPVMVARPPAPPPAVPVARPMPAPPPVRHSRPGGRNWLLVGIAVLVCTAVGAGAAWLQHHPAHIQRPEK